MSKNSKLKTQNSKLSSAKSNLKVKNSSLEPQTMEELLKVTGYQLRGLKRGDILEGTIASITPKEILVDIGQKSLGVVSEREMEQFKNLISSFKVGDKISVQVVSPESEAGQIILSIRRAGMDKKWEELLKKKEKNEILEVIGLETIKSGILVDWQGLRGFIPASQLSSSSDQITGKVFKVVVLEADKIENRLVFSEKKAVSPEKLAEKKEILAKIEIGQTFNGKVSGLVPFGVFVLVDLPNNQKVEGLVHISEISWEKVTNPSDYFKIGDKVKVLVISKEEKTGRLNLSIKQLAPDPWQELVKKYSLEQKVEGKVVKVSSFGILVELEKGVEGLIHISKIPAGIELKEGEKVTCLIDGINSQKRRINLSLVLKEKPVGYR